MTPRLQRRVLAIAPTPKDGSLLVSMLSEAGVECELCADACTMAREFAKGAGALLVTEESLVPPAFDLMIELLSAQPPWSDVPVLLITQHGADSPIVERTLREFSNATVVERPIRVSALLSLVRGALRARERQWQISRQIEEIAEANRRKDEFLATLAHELRNPLAPIRNSIHVLKLRAGPDPDMQRVQQIMERQVDHLVRLVDDLMEVSRITRGKIELRRQAIDVQAVLRAAIETSQPLIDRGRHQLTTEFPDEPVAVNGDPVRLAQVFSNLFNNAAKYSSPGGVILVRLGREGGDARVSVCDQGDGIAPELLPRVFDIFAQADIGTRRSQDGLGIGLALVRSLVQMHGGSVEARSDGPGCGSEFTVRLPLAPGVAASPASVRADPPAPLPYAQRILVVDDNQDAAETTAALLTLLGARVDIAHDGHAALKSVREHHQRIVLLDIGMPDLDGYEVAGRIRRDASIGPVTLVALTGWSQERDRRRAKDAGFDHHLVKPVDVAALQSLLTRVGT